jgi:hypothetical protein
MYRTILYVVTFGWLRDAFWAAMCRADQAQQRHAAQQVYDRRFGELERRARNNPALMVETRRLQRAELDRLVQRRDHMIEVIKSGRDSEILLTRRLRIITNRLRRLVAICDAQALILPTMFQAEEAAKLPVGRRYLKHRLTAELKLRAAAEARIRLLERRKADTQLDLETLTYTMDEAERQLYGLNDAIDALESTFQLVLIREALHQSCA